MRVKFFAYFRDYTGEKEIKTHHYPTVKELLLFLAEEYGKKMRDALFDRQEISGEVIILVNGRNIYFLDEINTELCDEDEISIFPVVAGG